MQFNIYVNIMHVDANRYITNVIQPEIAILKKPLNRNFLNGLSKHILLSFILTYICSKGKLKP